MLFTKRRKRNQIKYEYEGSKEICYVHRICDALCFRLGLSYHGDASALEAV